MKNQERWCDESLHCYVAVSCWRDKCLTGSSKNQWLTPYQPPSSFRGNASQEPCAQRGVWEVCVAAGLYRVHWVSWADSAPVRRFATWPLSQLSWSPCMLLADVVRAPFHLSTSRNLRLRCLHTVHEKWCSPSCTGVSTGWRDSYKSAKVVCVSEHKPGAAQ